MYRVWTESPRCAELTCQTKCDRCYRMEIGTTKRLKSRGTTYSAWERSCGSLVHVFPFREARFGRGQDVAVARNPYVKCWQKEYAHHQVGDESANDDNCEGT